MKSGFCLGAQDTLTLTCLPLSVILCFIGTLWGELWTEVQMACAEWYKTTLIYLPASVCTSTGLKSKSTVFLLIIQVCSGGDDGDYRINLSGMLKVSNESVKITIIKESKSCLTYAFSCVELCRTICICDLYISFRVSNSNKSYCIFEIFRWAYPTLLHGNASTPDGGVGEWCCYFNKSSKRSTSRINVNKKRICC